MYALIQSQNKYKKELLKVDLSFPYPQKLSYFFPSKWTKKCIEEQLSKPFFLFLANQDTIPT